MRLDQELFRRGLCESRTEAQELIAKGFVFVDGVVYTKQTKNVTELQVIEVSSTRKFVGRGGEKLHGILHDIFGSEEAIHEFCRNKSALDVGSSTGGFSDCLLTYGVLSVDAVDVGNNQIHKKIKGNKKVRVYENTDIRNFVTDMKYDIVVVDVSFISLKSIFDNLLTYGKHGAHYFLLIKPQFEVGKGNTKKGIVKDVTLTNDILNKYKDICKERNCGSPSIRPSLIEGGDGNQEYFLHFTLL